MQIRKNIILTTVPPCPSFCLTSYRSHEMDVRCSTHIELRSNAATDPDFNQSNNVVYGERMGVATRFEKG